VRIENLSRQSARDPNAHGAYMNHQQAQQIKDLSLAWVEAAVQCTIEASNSPRQHVLADLTQKNRDAHDALCKAIDRAIDTSAISGRRKLADLPWSEIEYILVNEPSDKRTNPKSYKLGPIRDLASSTFLAVFAALDADREGVASYRHLATLEDTKSWIIFDWSLDANGSGFLQTSDLRGALPQDDKSWLLKDGMTISFGRVATV
jgi:hypothetical protein